VARELSKAELDEKQKQAWVEEHLPYELMMLRHTLKRITQKQNMFFLDWNAAHASFAVHAANLAAFLTNGESGNNNLKACELVPNFRSRKGKLDTTFNKMEPQIFHLGKARPNAGQLKFNTEDAEKVSQWLEAEMKKFVEALLKTSYAEYWIEDRSVPPPENGPGMYIDASNPSASSGTPQTISYTGMDDPNRK
jgi:hypothetical protein